jgi:hypothetical protein
MLYWKKCSKRNVLFFNSLTNSIVQIEIDCNLLILQVKFSPDFACKSKALSKKYRCVFCDTSYLTLPKQHFPLSPPVFFLEGAASSPCPCLHNSLSTREREKKHQAWHNKHHNASKIIRVIFLGAMRRSINLNLWWLHEHLSLSFLLLRFSENKSGKREKARAAEKRCRCWWNNNNITPFLIRPLRATHTHRGNY